MKHHLRVAVRYHSVMAKLRQLSCRMCLAVKSDDKEHYIVLFKVQSALRLIDNRIKDRMKQASRKGGKTHGAVAQLARAPALQAGCRGFEPLRLHQIFPGV